MSKRRDRKKSDWSESEDSEEEKRSYEPSKHASDPLIKSKGFKKKGEDSTKSEVATPKAAVKSAESVKASAKKSKKEKRAVQ